MSFEDWLRQQLSGMPVLGGMANLPAPSPRPVTPSAPTPADVAAMVASLSNGVNAMGATAGPPVVGPMPSQPIAPAHYTPPAPAPTPAQLQAAVVGVPRPTPNAAMPNPLLPNPAIYGPSSYEDPVAGAIKQTITDPVGAAKTAAGGFVEATSYAQNQVALQLASLAVGVAQGDFSAEMASHAMQSGPFGKLVKEIPNASQMLVWAEGNDENSKESILAAYDKGYTDKKGVKHDPGNESVLAMYYDSLNFAGDLAFQTLTDPTIVIPIAGELGKAGTTVRAAEEAGAAARAGAAAVRGGGKVLETAAKVAELPDEAVGQVLSGTGKVIRKIPGVDEMLTKSADTLANEAERARRSALETFGRSEAVQDIVRRATGDAGTTVTQEGGNLGGDLLGGVPTSGPRPSGPAPAPAGAIPNLHGEIAGDIVGGIGTSQIIRTPKGLYGVQDETGKAIAMDLQTYVQAEHVARIREGIGLPEGGVDLESLVASEDLGPAGPLGNQPEIPGLPGIKPGPSSAPGTPQFPPDPNAPGLDLGRTVEGPPPIAPSDIATQQSTIPDAPGEIPDTIFSRDEEPGIFTEYLGPDEGAGRMRELSPEEIAYQNRPFEGPEEKYQFVRNADGGQTFGNQEMVVELTPQMRESLGVSPNQPGDYAVLTRTEKTKAWELEATGTLAEVRPDPDQWVRQWWRQVDDFESPEAIRWGQSYDQLRRGGDPGGPGAYPFSGPEMLIPRERVPVGRMPIDKASDEAIALNAERRAQYSTKTSSLAPESVAEAAPVPGVTPASQPLPGQPTERRVSYRDEPLSQLSLVELADDYRITSGVTQQHRMGALDPRALFDEKTNIADSSALYDEILSRKKAAAEKAYGPLQIAEDNGSWVVSDRSGELGRYADEESARLEARETLEFQRANGLTAEVTDAIERGAPPPTTASEVTPPTDVGAVPFVADINPDVVPGPELGQMRDTTSSFTPPDPKAHPTLANGPHRPMRDGEPRPAFLGPQEGGTRAVDIAATKDPAKATKFYDLWEKKAKDLEAQLDTSAKEFRSTPSKPKPGEEGDSYARRRFRNKVKQVGEETMVQRESADIYRQVFGEEPPPYQPRYGGTPENFVDIIRPGGKSNPVIQNQFDTQAQHWYEAIGNAGKLGRSMSNAERMKVADEFNALAELAITTPDDALAMDIRATLHGVKSPHLRDWADNVAEQLADWRDQFYPGASSLKRPDITRRAAENSIDAGTGIAKVGTITKAGSRFEVPLTMDNGQVLRVVEDSESKLKARIGELQARPLGEAPITEGAPTGPNPHVTWPGEPTHEGALIGNTRQPSYRGPMPDVWKKAKQAPSLEEGLAVFDQYGINRYGAREKFVRPGQRKAWGKLIADQPEVYEGTGGKAWEVIDQNKEAFRQAWEQAPQREMPSITEEQAAAISEGTDLPPQEPPLTGETAPPPSSTTVEMDTGGAQPGDAGLGSGHPSPTVQAFFEKTGPPTTGTTLGRPHSNVQSFDPSSANAVLRAWRQGDISGDYDLFLRNRELGLGADQPLTKRELARQNTPEYLSVDRTKDDVLAGIDRQSDAAVLLSKVKTGGDWKIQKQGLKKRSVLTGADESKSLAEVYLEQVEKLGDVDAALKATMDLVQRDSDKIIRTRGMRALRAFNTAIKEGMMFSWTKAPQRWMGDNVGNAWTLISNGRLDAVANMAGESNVFRDDSVLRGAWDATGNHAAEGLAKSDMGQMYQKLGLNQSGAVETGLAHGREEVDRDHTTALVRFMKDRIGTSDRVSKFVGQIGAGTGIAASEAMKRSVTAMDTAWRGALHWTEFSKGYQPILDDFWREADSRLLKLTDDPEAARKFTAALGGRDGVFSPADVRGAGRLVGMKAGDAEHLARSWRRDTTRLMKRADAETNRLFFDFQATNLDEALSNFFFFHHWVSRATPLYARTALRNPAVMAAYGHFKEAMDRQSPEGHDGYLKLFDGPAGIAAYFNPLYMLSTTLINFEQDFQNPDARMLDRILQKSPAMLAPMLQGAISFLGLSSQGNVDPLGMWGPRRMWEGLINLGRAQGIWGEKSMWVDPTPEFYSKLVSASSEWMERHDSPFAKKVVNKMRERNDVAILNGLIMDRVYKRYGIDPSVDPETLRETNPKAFSELTAGIAAAETGDETNADAAGAFVDWAKGGAIGRSIFGASIPGGVRLGLDSADARDRILYDSPDAKTYEKQAAGNQKNLITAAGPEDLSLEVTGMARRAAGSATGRLASEWWNDVAYSPDPPTRFLLGRNWTKEQQLDPAYMSSQGVTREDLADAYIAEHGMAADLGATRDARNAIDQQNPIYGEYEDWAKGARKIGMEKLMDASPSYRGYINGLPDKVKNDPRSLSTAAFSVDAWQATEGKRSSITSPDPYSMKTDISQINPVDLMTGGGEDTKQQGGSPTDVVGQLTRDSLRYQTDLAYLDAAVQALVGSPTAHYDPNMNPMAKGALDWHLAQAGITIPSKPASIANYEAWVQARQASGKPFDLAAYAQWAAEMDPMAKQLGITLNQLMGIATNHPDAVDKVLKGRGSVSPQSVVGANP